MSPLLRKPTDFSLQHCEPCHKDTTALTRDEAEILLTALTGWNLSTDSKCLIKSFPFRDFSQALHFINQVGEVSEKEQHHPDITFGWGYADIKIHTHAVHGLHRNDFILASKIDKIK